MYPNLANALVGHYNLPDQTVYLPNLGSFTETINYMYTSSSSTIGYTAQSYIPVSSISSNWTKYWGQDDLFNYTKHGDDLYKANCVPLDAEFYALDKNGDRLVTKHPSAFVLESTKYLGEDDYPEWNLPNAAVYVAPHYISNTKPNTWIEQIEQTSTPSASTVTGYYWIAY